MTSGPIMNHPEDRLEWLAFCYLANELDADDREAFELQLATDQESREAVARLVQETARLSDALAEPATVTSASTSLAWSRDASRWLAISISSCLVLLVLFSASQVVKVMPLQSKSSPDVANTSLGTAELAYAWAGTLPETEEGGVVESLDLLWDGAVGDDADDSLAAPSWMLAAVAGIRGDVTSDLERQE